MTFGNRLRQERRRRHLSQEAMAEALGISSKSISRWEQGQAIPQGYTRLQLCSLFHLQPEDLFEGLDEELPPQQLWNVPYARNPFFTGREEILHALHRQLNQEHSMALTQSLAINGLGGIGKTQIALEYAYQYRQDYRFIFWTSAATRETLQADIVTLANLLQLPERNDQDQKKVLQAVKRWFATHERWLWILDNADDVTIIHDVLPTERPGHLLLTSRAQAWGSLARRVEVETMGLTEGTLFLLRRARLLAPDAFLDQISEEHLSTAEAIVLEMDFLPLALDQAGTYIEEVGCNLSDYLELYRARRKDLLLRRGHLPNDHPEPVATTWSLSFQKVEQANPAAADLLRLGAFLEPDTIPEELISEGAEALSPVLQSAARDVLLLNGAIEELRKFSLIQRDPEARLFRLHRLVQAILKDNMGPEAQLQWARQAVGATNRVFPAVVEASTWPRCRRFLAQAQTCSGLIQDYALTDSEAAALLLRTATYLQMYALYEQAEPLYQMTLRIQQETLEPEHPDLAATYEGLATLHLNQGKYDSAETFFQSAIALQKQGTNPEVARSLTGLANLYVQQGKFEEAEPLFKMALSIWEDALGPEHPELAVSLTGLGILYLRQGRNEQAEPLLQQALSIREQLLGVEHLEFARSLHNWALLYWQQGKYEQAEPLLQRALSIKEQFLGAEHPDLARSLHNLAALYWQIGKFEQARPLFQRAIAISEQCLGAEHSNTAMSIQGLALLYDLLEKYEQAEPLFQRALAIFEQHLGAEHPETGRNLYNLARLYLRQKKYEQAEPLLLRALAIREQQLGAEHPDTAESLCGLGKLYQGLGKFEEAELLHQRALSIRRQSLDANHPETAESLHGLAELYHHQKKEAEAEALYEQALHIREKQRLQSHPDTAQILYDFAAFRETQGRNQEAASLYQRSLTIREHILGPEHATTMLTQTAYHALQHSAP